MRPLIRMSYWVCIVSSLALAASVLSSPIRKPRTSHARVCPNLLSRSFALVSLGPGLVLTSATPDRMSTDADHSDFEEEDEDKSSWSFSHLICSAFIPADSPTKLLSDPRPCHAPARTAAALPLRC